LKDVDGVGQLPGAPWAAAEHGSPLADDADLGRSLHGDQVNVLTGTLPHLAAIALAAGLGAWVRTNRHPVIPAAAGPGGATATA
jgi:hypothetical protein